MTQENLGEQVYKKVAERMTLTPHDGFDDIKTIITPDGREVGSFKAFTAEKVQKFSLAEFSLAPGMNYTNASLKPAYEYNIPRFSFNYMAMGDKIQFDVDLYPAVDLAPRQDYVDKYYEMLTDTYLNAKRDPCFDWKVSDRSWVRVSASPYFFMSAAGMDCADKVYALIHKYLDVALKIFDEEEKVSQNEAQQIRYRTEYIVRMLIEREPERHLLEKAFGKELTERLAHAMV